MICEKLAFLAAAQWRDPPNVRVDTPYDFDARGVGPFQSARGCTCHHDGQVKQLHVMSSLPV